MKKKYRVGCDIGGTFTDFALLDLESGSIDVHKILTTPRDPSDGALKGTTDLLNEFNANATDIDIYVHGTTLAANALIERKGTKVGLITTKGFRDLLEIGTEQMYDIYDIFVKIPEPLVPRPLRMEVEERIDSKGTILTSLNEKDVLEVSRELISSGVKAIAVCLLHSYINPEHEKRIGALIKLNFPTIDISLSSEIAPEIREYERTSTTVANAYIQPLMRDYLKKIDSGLRTRGFEGEFYPLLSSGGTVPISTALQYPIRLAESGPAAGAVGAAFIAKQGKLGNIIAFDMGGTTAKISVIENYKPRVTPVFEVARTDRFKKGSGLPLQMPAVDILEIGSGGGSIAWVDKLGLLKVGPESSGSDPGPACYDMGGTEPTITDANLVLGYLNPDYFVGGKMKLNIDNANRSMGAIGKTLNMTSLEVADSIHQLVNENMFSAAHIHVIEQGQDPRNFSLMAFGGGGPIHGSCVGQALNVSEVICPPSAGVLSALGLLMAPISFEFVRSLPIQITEVKAEAIQSIFQEMSSVGLDMSKKAGIDQKQIKIIASIDARFIGQMHEINVPLDLDNKNSLNANELSAKFLQEYQTLYKHTPKGNLPIEIISWRVIVTGQLPNVKLPESKLKDSNIKTALKGTRKAYFFEKKILIEVPVYDRYKLSTGMVLEGPAIIEERESTVILRPTNFAKVDSKLNIRIHLNKV